LRSNRKVPKCYTFRYFEVEILENRSNSEICVGLTNKENFNDNSCFAPQKNSILVKGLSGEFFVGEEAEIPDLGYAKKSTKIRELSKDIGARKLSTPFKDFGQCLGICLYVD
jgi:hypothetical protein